MLGPGGGWNFRIKKMEIAYSSAENQKKFRQIWQQNKMKFSEFSILDFVIQLFFCKDLVLI